MILSRLDKAALRDLSETLRAGTQSNSFLRLWISRKNLPRSKKNTKMAFDRFIVSKDVTRWKSWDTCFLFCLCECIYECLLFWVCMLMPVSMCIHMLVCLSVYVSVLLCVLVYASISVYVSVCVFMCIGVFQYVYQCIGCTHQHMVHTYKSKCHTLKGHFYPPFH